MCQKYPIIRFREFKVVSVFSPYKCCCGQERCSLPLKTQWAIVGMIVFEILLAPIPNTLLIGVVSRIWLMIVNLLWLTFECLVLKIVAYCCYHNFIVHTANKH